ANVGPVALNFGALGLQSVRPDHALDDLALVIDPKQGPRAGVGSGQLTNFLGSLLLPFFLRDLARSGDRKKDDERGVKVGERYDSVLLGCQDPVHELSPMWLRFTRPSQCFPHWFAVVVSLFDGYRS